MSIYQSKIKADIDELSRLVKGVQADIFLEESLQKIYYGAPGTGKSNRIKEEVDDKKEKNFRVTFHPDSDYSTFVGCYKPTMEGKSQDVILDYNSLVDKLKEYLDSSKDNLTRAFTFFGFDYHDSLIKMQENGHTIPTLVTDAYKSGTTYDTQVRVGMNLYEKEKVDDNNDSKIVYTFRPQAFTNAYVEAWNTTDKVYLIIEEINRGNCAQIFGDLFQLLDRNDQGFSVYPINADIDLQSYISKKLAKTTRTDISNEVKNGSKLMLPNNLYIWATMNTSDQSLFPIDSAFKRRWDWVYMPIKNAGKGWVIEVKDENGTKKYDWWEFIQKINAEIDDLTSSEDKKLGYFFCKAKDRVVSADMFVNKVMFYLWNDVVKDYDLSGREAFQDNDGKVLTFGKFYDDQARAIKKMMENLGVNEINDENNNVLASDADASVGVFAVNGESFKVLGDVVYRAVELFVNNNPTMKDIDVANAWKQIKGTGTGFKYLVETAAEHDARKAISTDARFDNRAKVLTTPMSEILYVSTEWTKEMVSNFMDQVNAQGWEITITKVAE